MPYSLGSGGARILIKGGGGGSGDNVAYIVGLMPEGP